MEFLINLEFEFGTAVDRSKIITEERAAAEKLKEAGKLIRMWRVPCTNANWTLWSVNSLDELHSIFIALPMYPYFRNLKVFPLAEHPVDPRLQP